MAGELRTLPNVAVGPGSGGLAERLTAADQVRLKRYQEYLDWYSGKHWGKERRGRSNLTLNYCRAIVDKGVSYLLGRGIGFAVDAGKATGNRQQAAGEEGTGGRGGLSGRGGRDGQGDGGTEKERAAAAEGLIYRVYEDSELEAVDIQAATNGCVLGDTVFKVVWDGERGLPRVVNQDPMRFFCSWAEDDLARMLKAHCVYGLSVEEATRRYGDAGTRRHGDAGTGRHGDAGRGFVGVVETWTERTLEVWVGDSLVVSQANPYGFIPFVHIPNARPANEFWGVSDLKDLIPLNRELNERFSDMADVIRFHADPPVVFKGVSEHTQMVVGPGTVWDIPEGSDVFLLEWRGQQPAVFEHIDRVMRALHDVAETPKTAFGESGRIQSGVALEVEMQSLVQKTMRKRALWSGGLRRRNAMVLRIGELMGLGRFAPYESKVMWPALLPTDQAVEVENQVKLVEAGLRSRATAMDRLGEESPEEEMGRIEGDRRTELREAVARG